jgi:hypothetical protein
MMQLDGTRARRIAPWIRNWVAPWIGTWIGTWIAPCIGTCIGRGIGRGIGTCIERGSATMIRALAALTCTMAVTGCATTTLTPAPSAATIPGEPNTVIDRVDGVSVTIESNAWNGSRGVLSAVEPIRVTISNQGSTPIRLRYSDFALVDPTGRRYAALPPYRVEGSLLNPFIPDGYAIIDMPRFVFRGFYVAPYYSRIYPGIPVYSLRYYFYDPFYYDYYYRDLTSSIRPTMEMLSLGLPEGVVDVGGYVTGFLYFQRVRPNVDSVTLRGTLVAVGVTDEAAGGARFGEISIPFMVTTTR